MHRSVRAVFGTMLGSPADRMIGRVADGAGRARPRVPSMPDAASVISRPFGRVGFACV